MQEIFKLNIENQDPSLKISFSKNYRDVTDWINSTKFKVLSKIGILKKIKNDLIKEKLICCLCITMPMGEILHNRIYLCLAHDVLNHNPNKYTSKI